MNHLKLLHRCSSLTNNRNTFCGITPFNNKVFFRVHFNYSLSCKYNIFDDKKKAVPLLYHTEQRMVAEIMLNSWLLHDFSFTKSGSSRGGAWSVIYINPGSYSNAQTICTPNPDLIELQNRSIGPDFGLYRNQTQASATLNSELLIFKVRKQSTSGGFVRDRPSRLD